MKLTTTSCIFGVLAAQGSCQSLPQVDLGYEIHQAIAYNVCDAAILIDVSNKYDSKLINTTISVTFDMHNLQLVT